MQVQLLAKSNVKISDCIFAGISDYHASSTRPIDEEERNPTISIMSRSIFALINMMLNAATIDWSCDIPRKYGVIS